MVKIGLVHKAASIQNPQVPKGIRMEVPITAAAYARRQPG